MFDLNVDLYSTCDELETKIPMEKPTEGNDCNRTSISLSNGISLLSFGILSKGKPRKTKIEDDCNENSPPVLVTRQLFPMAGGGGGGVGDSEESSLRPQGLNLSFSDTARGGSEFRKFQQKNQKMKKSRRGPKSRSSEYRGVTFYRRTGRWESHIWDCGKQLYLGSFDTPLAAARVFDRAAIKFRGVDADINFNVCDYEEDMDKMNNLSKEEFLRLVRRRSTKFSQGSSKYRGVTLHECGRWETCTGQFLGKNLQVYLSCKFIYVPCSFYFNTEVKAARAYDKATINCNAREVAFTNFEASASDTEMSMNAKNLGRSTAQSLDLNLCISPPTNVSACNPSF